MKIIYLANARIPTQKTHGIQIMNMSETFADLGHEVELVVPKRINDLEENPFKFYGVKNNFNIKTLWSLDLTRFGFLGFLIQSFTFGISSFFYLKKTNNDLIYGRDEFSLFFISFLKKSFVWEAHDARDNFLIRRILKKAQKIITITKGLKDFYVNRDISPEKIIVSPDGVDVNQFNINISKEEAKKKTGLHQYSKIALYSGHLYDWKGVHILAESAKLLSDSVFVFVGGNDKDINNFKNEYSQLKNIVVVGRRAHNETPFYLKSADVLVLPNSSKEDISKLYTSPLKLFEYMASNVPIVASDLPSLREVLNEQNAVLVSPDNPNALAQGIESAFGRDDLARSALRDVEKYSWDERAKSILNNIK